MGKSEEMRAAVEAWPECLTTAGWLSGDSKAKEASASEAPIETSNKVTKFACLSVLTI